MITKEAAVPAAAAASSVSHSNIAAIVWPFFITSQRAMANGIPAIRALWWCSWAILHSFFINVIYTLSAAGDNVLLPTRPPTPPHLPIGRRRRLWRNDINKRRRIWEKECEKSDYSLWRSFSTVSMTVWTALHLVRDRRLVQMTEREGSTHTFSLDNLFFDHLPSLPLKNNRVIHQTAAPVTEAWWEKGPTHFTYCSSVFGFWQITLRLNHTASFKCPAWNNKWHLMVQRGSVVRGSPENVFCCQKNPALTPKAAHSVFAFASCLK